MQSDISTTVILPSTKLRRRLVHSIIKTRAKFRAAIGQILCCLYIVYVS